MKAIPRLELGAVKLPYPKKRATFIVSDELLDELRNAVVEFPSFTMSTFLEEALTLHLAKLREDWNAGLGFRPRRQDVRRGRPRARR
jgi:hypothetical protein